MDYLTIKLICVSISISIIAGILGSLMVWRQIAFLGDAISHSALLGSALAVATACESHFVLMAICICISLILILRTDNYKISSDSLLSIFASTTMALGIIIYSFTDNSNNNLIEAILGDMIAITFTEIIYLFILASLVAILFITYYKKILIVFINEEIALSDGIAIKKIKVLFAVILGVAIGLLLKTMGVLLMTAILIIPAAAARIFCSYPYQMVISTIVITLIAFLLGTVFSYNLDTPYSASIVLVASFLLIIIKICSHINQYRNKR